MARIIATLNDADVTLNLEEDGPDYRVKATRCDGVSLPQTALEQSFANLGEAIKAIAIFYVSEWESVFITNRLSEKLVNAIQAS